MVLTQHPARGPSQRVERMGERVPPSAFKRRRFLRAAPLASLPSVGSAWWAYSSCAGNVKLLKNAAFTKSRTVLINSSDISIKPNWRNGQNPFEQSIDSTVNASEGLSHHPAESSRHSYAVSDHPYAEMGLTPHSKPGHSIVDVSS